VICAPKVATGLSPGFKWREDKVRMRMVLARKGPLGFSPVSNPEPRHRLEAYATLLSGVSSDLSKCFLRGVPRAHRYHATVLVFLVLAQRGSPAVEK
jgi:hypothetical protein